MRFVSDSFVIFSRQVEIFVEFLLLVFVLCFDDIRVLHVDDLYTKSPSVNITTQRFDLKVPSLRT